MYNPFSNLKINVFGQSHSPEIGVEIFGLPIGTKIDVNYVQSFVDRRKSGKNPWSTPRKEPDEIVFVNGLEEGVVTDYIKAVIYNKTVRSVDYENISTIPRPSHADYVSAIKDGTNKVTPGGGRFSGRLTAPLSIAGGIAKYLLEQRGIKVLSYVRSIGEVEGENYAYNTVNAEKIENLQGELPALSRADEMISQVINAKNQGDSVGGVVDVMVFNLPLGVGDNLFNGLEGRISSAVYGVPAVKGVEFGLGFKMSKLLGSQANDELFYNGEKIITTTNNAGGINGGISNGMPIALSVAIRPTPSISKEQNSVDLKTMENVKFSVKGRHDACIVPRAAVVLEGVVALAILDALLDE